MGKLQKLKDNSPLRSAAEKMVEFIRNWRSEISDKKDIAPNISPSELEDFLTRSESQGVRPTIAAYVILGCEFTFRIRRVREKDINIFLDDMESRLGGGPEPMLTPLQAHIVVKSVEPMARKLLTKIRMPIIFGPLSFSDYAGLEIFQTIPLGQRRPPRTLVSPKRGRIPIIGPIIAGVWLDLITKGGGGLGVDLCRLLLQRDVQPEEFAGWRSKLKEIIPELSKQTFYDDWLDRLPLAELIEQCQIDPMVAFAHRTAQFDLFRKLYSISWR